MKITIAGGGIGGLVTALRLHQAGFQVKVFESVKEVSPLGVGINLLPHAIRVLTNIGLQEKNPVNCRGDEGVDICEPTWTIVLV